MKVALYIKLVAGLGLFLGCALVGYYWPACVAFVGWPSTRGVSALNTASSAQGGTAAHSYASKTVAAQTGNQAIDGNNAAVAINAALNSRNYKKAEALLSALARSDPRKALEGIAALPAWARSRATDVVLREWLSTSPAAAWAYISAKPPDFFEMSSDFYSAITTAGRPDIGLQAIDRMPLPVDRLVAAHTFIPVWANTDLEGLARAAATMPPDIRSMAYVELATKLYASGPVDQAQLNSMLGENSNDINGAWSNFAQQLIGEEGYARARDVFLQVAQPNGTGSGAYTALALNAPVEDAAGWLAKISDEALRNSATGMVANRLDSIGDPAAAAQIAITSSNQNVVAKQLERILPRWAAKDPVAAINFVQTSTALSPADKQSLALKLTPLLTPHS